MAWTDEMVADLRKMWAEGLTTGEIAKRLSVSKNSIVGKVHRLGLSGRPSPIKKKTPVEGQAETPKEHKTPKKEKAEAKIEVLKEEKAEAPKAPKKETKKEKAPKEANEVIEETKEVKHSKKEPEQVKTDDGIIRLTDLDMHTCRWPIGDPKDEKFHFCGKKVRIGHTYCDEHSEIAYVKQTKGR
ncbi:MAG: GcrA family cell cycle regulator [Lactobacillaceae bacterium]|jgi:GcrA cell cycle regulator|nr:GcrA family cell cycle regulator [Lactobacillaceae bacterium]